MAFDSVAEPAKALAVEVAENEKRKAYTKEEVQALAERLKAAGYHCTRGRPANGQKAVAPALAAILGKHERTIRRMLTEDATCESKVESTHEKAAGNESSQIALDALTLLTRLCNCIPDADGGSRSKTWRALHDARAALLEFLKAEGESYASHEEGGG